MTAGELIAAVVVAFILYMVLKSSPASLKRDSAGECGRGIVDEAATALVDVSHQMIGFDAPSGSPPPSGARRPPE